MQVKPTTPVSLKANPLLKQWLNIDINGKILAFSGKVEIGQGILHALRHEVACQLGLNPAEVIMVRASTACSPDEAVTSGSLSIQDSGLALRFAAADLRERCRQAFAEKHHIALSRVNLKNGRWQDDQGQFAASYSDLINDTILSGEVKINGHNCSSEYAAEAIAHSAREDITARVFGQYEYIQDIELEEMLHGYVFRPRTLAATIDQKNTDVIVAELSNLPDAIKVQWDGLLIKFLASSERAVLRAAEIIERRNPWLSDIDTPARHQISAWLKAQQIETTIVNEPSFQSSGKQLEQTIENAQLTHFAEYQRPYLQHASIGLCCALAHRQMGKLKVWTHSQGIFNLRRDLALALCMRAEDITVEHHEGAGCYGHNGADDVAFDAALLAQMADDKPVRVQWTRKDEFGVAPLGPAMAVAICASVDANGRINNWSQEVWSQGHGTRPGRGTTPALLGAWQQQNHFPVTMAVNAAMAVGGGSERNATPPYAIPTLDVKNHRVLTMPVRVSALRGLGAHVNVFAAESFVDELAHKLGVDAVEYRLMHLLDPRAKSVITAAQALALNDPVNLSEGWGRGMGFARYKNTGAYCAVIAEVCVEDIVKIKNLYIAADVGRAVHPDGAINQIEGGAIQAASWTLMESAELGSDGISSDSWDNYPIMRFSQTPRISTRLVGSSDNPPLGAGECSIGPTAAAIGNAVFNAIGVRVRQLPLTPEHITKAIDAN